MGLNSYRLILPDRFPIPTKIRWNQPIDRFYLIGFQFLKNHSISIWWVLNSYKSIVAVAGEQRWWGGVLKKGTTKALMYACQGDRRVRCCLKWVLYTPRYTHVKRNLHEESNTEPEANILL